MVGIDINCGFAEAVVVGGVCVVIVVDVFGTGVVGIGGVGLSASHSSTSL